MVKSPYLIFAILFSVPFLIAGIVAQAFQSVAQGIAIDGSLDIHLWRTFALEDDTQEVAAVSITLLLFVVFALVGVVIRNGMELYDEEDLGLLN